MQVPHRVLVGLWAALLGGACGSSGAVTTAEVSGDDVAFDRIHCDLAPEEYAEGLTRLYAVSGSGLASDGTRFTVTMFSTETPDGIREQISVETTAPDAPLGDVYQGEQLLEDDRGAAVEREGDVFTVSSEVTLLESVAERLEGSATDARTAASLVPAEDPPESLAVNVTINCDDSEPPNPD